MVFYDEGFRKIRYKKVSTIRKFLFLISGIFQKCSCIEKSIPDNRNFSKLEIVT